MASITDINYIQILFRCTQTVDKSLTKAIWIIYIILSQEQTLHVPPIRFGTLMQFKLIFQMMIQSNGQSGDDTSSVSNALIGR